MAERPGSAGFLAFEATRLPDGRVLALDEPPCVAMRAWLRSSQPCTPASGRLEDAFRPSRPLTEAAKVERTARLLGREAD